MKTSVYITLFLLFAPTVYARASSSDTIKAGSYIINMGVMPQTVANGLKPYGLVYDLLKNYKIPVKWAISPSKSKDGIDFAHNGINYSGGTFIIPYEFRTPSVNSLISTWQSQGVVGYTSVSDFVTTVFQTLHHPPIWTLDKANGSLAVNYFNNAGIPSSAYGGSSSTAWKDPSQLVSCDDIFVLPHADPTWSSHNNLYYWNLDFKGNIWSGCHSVSVLENTVNPGNTIQLNFLSTTGLVSAGSHGNGSPPFQYSYPNDPVMQFVGIADGATNNGSERIYLPKSGGGWRPTTKIAMYDATQADVPSLSPGQAAIIASGRGYGSDSRGWVMYEGGHNHNTAGTIEERVAAQRAFFNFSFFSTSDKNAWFDIQLNNIPETLIPNNTITLSFSVPPTVNLNEYVVQWSSSCGGTFSSTGDPQSVNFTAPSSTGPCVITANLVNACNREVFASRGTYLSAVLPLSITQFHADYEHFASMVTLSWKSSGTDEAATYIIEKSDNGCDFSAIDALTSGNSSGLTSSYIFQDPKRLTNTTYYRIKMLMPGANFRYSTVLKVNPGRTFSTEIVPDFPSGEIHVKYYSKHNQDLQLSLIDINGRLVTSKIVQVKQGVNSYAFRVGGRLPPGLYFLTMNTAMLGGRKSTYKLLWN